MNISFLKDDPLNTVIVNSADERPLYEVNTPFKLKGRTTTIRRADSTGPEQGQILAQIFWHDWRPTKAAVHFLGEETPMNGFLRKERSFLSRSKVLTGIDGREYEWTHSKKSNKLTLADCQTSVMVAESHRRKFGIFSSKPRKMNIDILEQAIQNIDVIVVSFVIMEEKERERLAAVAASS